MCVYMCIGARAAPRKPRGSRPTNTIDNSNKNDSDSNSNSNRSNNNSNNDSS